MSFQIVIDCDTDHGMYYFGDARQRTQLILDHVATEVGRIMGNEAHALKPIRVGKVRLIKTINEMTA